MRCAGVCPVHAIGEGLTIDREICTAGNENDPCARCIAVCPQKALSVDSRYYTLDETLVVLRQDIPFYEESGGGVTLSGGEALLQRQFAVELLKALKNEKIHTAMETSGFASPECFTEISRLTDLLLFDLKHYDGIRHMEGTGVQNTLILSNLKNAIDSGLRVLPRIPVIPGYNDSPDDARGFTGIFESMGIKSVQLLPFHQLGEMKYGLLNLPYAMKGIPQLHPEDLAEYRRIFLDRGIDCFF